VAVLAVAMTYRYFMSLFDSTNYGPDRQRTTTRYAKSSYTVYDGHNNYSAKKELGIKRNKLVNAFS